MNGKQISLNTVVDRLDLTPVALPFINCRKGSVPKMSYRVKKEPQPKGKDLQRRRGSDDSRDGGMSKDEIEKTRNAFAKFDRNGDGRISAKELGTVLRAMGKNPTNGEIKSFMNDLDRDGSGHIEFAEFAIFMRSKFKSEDQEKELRAAFKHFDRDGSGFISERELRRVLTEIGEPMSRDEVEDLMKDADVDRDGQLSVNEFIRLMRST